MYDYDFNDILNELRNGADIKEIGDAFAAEMTRAYNDYNDELLGEYFDDLAFSWNEAVSTYIKKHEIDIDEEQFLINAVGAEKMVSQTIDFARAGLSGDPSMEIPSRNTNKKTEKNPKEAENANFKCGKTVCGVKKTTLSKDDAVFDKVIADFLNDIL